MVAEKEKIGSKKRQFFHYFFKWGMTSISSSVEHYTPFRFFLLCTNLSMSSNKLFVHLLNCMFSYFLYRLFCKENLKLILIIFLATFHSFSKDKWSEQVSRAGEPEPGVFGSLEPEPEPLEKNEEPEPLGKKSQEPEPVKISRLLSPARR